MNRQTPSRIAGAASTLAICVFAISTNGQDQSVSVSPVKLETWSQFRGPTGTGIALADDVAMQLDKQANVKWRSDTTGVGWSSPVINGNQIWITSAITTEATEEQRAAKLADVQFAKMKDVAGSFTMFAICLDSETGKTLIERELGVVDSPNPIHPMNSYASPSAAVADGRVVCHFGGYGTWCLDAETGKTIWESKLVVNDSVGPGSSPVIYKDRVIITCDGIDQQFVAALAMKDGSEIWKTPRPPIRETNGEFRKAYSTPLLITINGADQAVIPGSQWCVAYDPMEGQEIWRFDHGKGFSVTPMATLAGGKIVFSTGYMSPEIVAVDPTGRGNVTATHEAWRQGRNGPAKPSFVADKDHVYVISDEGILSVLHNATGKQVYRQRIGGQFSASPFVSGNRIMVANHDGEVTVFAAGATYLELHKYDLDEQVMASPVPVGKDLIVRTKEAVYRFGK